MKDPIIRFFIGLYVRLVYASRAIRDIKKPKLGDVVTYKGHEYFLIQGVANPFWDLYDATPSPGVAKRVDRCHVNEFKLEPLYKRFWFSFKSTYTFFMRYWFDIDVRNKGQFQYSRK